MISLCRRLVCTQYVRRTFYSLDQNPRLIIEVVSLNSTRQSILVELARYPSLIYRDTRVHSERCWYYVYPYFNIIDNVNNELLHRHTKLANLLANLDITVKEPV